MFVKFLGNGNMFQEILPKGIHYVEVALNEVPLFIRKGCAIPVADFAESVPDIKEESIRMVGYEGASYERYTDRRSFPYLILNTIFESSLPFTGVFRNPKLPGTPVIFSTVSRAFLLSNRSPDKKRESPASSLGVPVFAILSSLYSVFGSRTSTTAP